MGKSYPVSIGFTILDELNIHEIPVEKKEIERIGSGCEYYFRGLLHEDKIDAGLVFPEWIDKTVEIKVDRISIEFLRTKAD